MIVPVLSPGPLVPTPVLRVRRLHHAGFSGFASPFTFAPYLNYGT